MSTRTELVRIAEELYEIATDGLPLNVPRLDVLGALNERLDRVLELAWEDAMIEALQEANRAAA